VIGNIKDFEYVFGQTDCKLSDRLEGLWLHSTSHIVSVTVVDDFVA